MCMAHKSKDDDYLDDDNNKLTTSSHFKFCGKIFKQELTTAILKNDCHTLTVLDIASLEVTHSKDQLDQIKKVDRLFKTGWHHDEVINSFLNHWKASILFSTVVLLKPYTLLEESHSVYCGKELTLLTRS